MASKILIIDDKLDNLISLKALIKSLIKDCEVFTAMSGKEGIAMAIKMLPDTILLDVQMPDIDGFETCRQIKQKEHIKYIPIIMLTAKYGDINNKIKGLELGADAFLTKPIDEHELVAQVKAMLRIKSAEDLLRRENRLLEEAIEIRTKQVIGTEIRLDTLLNTISNPIFYKDKNCLYTGCNDAFSIFTGVKKEHIVGLSVFDIYEKELADIYNKADLELLVKGGSQSYDSRIRHIDGSLRDVIINKSIIKDDRGEVCGIVGTIVDITQRKVWEKALKESEERFRHAYWEAPYPIMIHAEDGEVLIINKAWTILTGYTIDDIPTMDIWLEKAHRERKEEVKRVINGLYNINIKVDEDNYSIHTKDNRILIWNFSSASLGVTYDGRRLVMSMAKDITDSVKNAEKLMILNSAVDNSTNEVLLFDMDLRRFEYINNGAIINLGYSQEEIMKMSPEDIRPEYTREEFILMLEPLQKNKVNKINFETIHRRKDKSEYSVEVHITKLNTNEKNYYLAIIIDITDRKQKEDLILLNNKRLKVLVDLSQMIGGDLKDIYNFTLDKAIELSNSEVGFLGYLNETETEIGIVAWSNGVMENCKIRMSIHKFSVVDSGIWGEVIKQRKPIIINDFSLYKGNGKNTPEGHISIERYLSVPVFDNNKIVAVMAIGNKKSDYNEIDLQQMVLLLDGMWDILKKQKYDDELMKAKDKAEEADRLKSAFLANMSHEIRTPMNGIIGFSEMLNKPNLSEERRRYFTSIIGESCNQLLSIVTDILDISKIETGQIERVESSVCVNELILDAFSHFESYRQKTNLSFYPYKVLNDNDSYIYTDEQKIRKVLYNLISNAIKFTTQGSIKFGYTFEKIYLRFFVTDTGIGIAKDLHEVIFERFRQAEDSYTRKYGGTGLGLAISKAYVNLLGGKIWVESEVGKGSTFYFTIPYNPVYANVVSDDNIDKKEESAGLKQYTVLIAEDEEINFLYLEEVLSDYNIKSIHAKDGREVIDLCTNRRDIDLVLMDIKMPYINGYDATIEIRKICPDLPIIAQTAYATPKDRLKALSCGCNDYLSKPMKTDVLIGIISKYLNLSEGAGNGF